MLRKTIIASLRIAIKLVVTASNCVLFLGGAGTAQAISWKEWAARFIALVEPARLEQLGHDEIAPYFAPLFDLNAVPGSICQNDFAAGEKPPFISGLKLSLVRPRYYHSRSPTDVPCALMRFGILDFDIEVRSGVDPRILGDLADEKFGAPEGHLGSGNNGGARWTFQDGALLIGSTGEPRRYHVTLVKVPPHDATSSDHESNREF